MTRTVLTQVQMQRFEASAEAANAGRERAGELLGERSKKIDEVFDLKKQAVDKAREAREEAGLFSLIGSILLPVIGTFLGKMLGGATVGDELDDKAAIDRRAARAELSGTALQGELADAREALDQAKGDKSNTERFIQALADGARERAVER